VEYSKLASDALTVVSIVIAVYITVASVLIGSTYAASLKRIPDTQNKGRSQLGSLRDYLTNGAFFGILTIVISSLYNLEITSLGKIWNGKIDLTRLISAFSCSTFALNIFFLWLVFKLMMVTMLNAATYENEGDNSNLR
jgi:hypothetical protein